MACLQNSFSGGVPMRLFLLSLMAVSLCAQKPTLHYDPANPGAVPQWIKCTVTNSSTNLVVSGTGCTAATIAKAAALTQTIPLFTLLANGFVSNYVLKTSTAFAGTTTLLAGLGTTGTPNLFLVSAVTGYNLNAAVAVGNLSTLPPLAVGSDTASATNAVLQLTSTVSNISSVSAGALDIWILWSVRP